MNYEQDEDTREIEDVSPSEPAGSARVTFDVPMPTVEQVGGEIARQLINSMGYDGRNAITKKAREIVDETIERIVTAKATPIIEELLAKPIQPTDGFGTPIGEPTSLQAVLAQHVTQWATTPVDSEGRPKKSDSYSKGAPRIDWALGAVVNGPLKKLVDEEVKRITNQLREAATANIAKQIGEQVSKLVLK